MPDFVGMELNNAICEFENKKILYKIERAVSNKTLTGNTIDVVIRQKKLEDNTLLITVNKIKTII